MLERVLNEFGSYSFNSPFQPIERVKSTGRLLPKSELVVEQCSRIHQGYIKE